MPRNKGNFSCLTDQDLYWDGTDEDSKRYGIEGFKRDIKNEIHKEKIRYRDFVEDTSDDWVLELISGRIDRIR